ncbi:MAG: glycosyltransferase family 39 protein [Tepidisphaeraceae bacterium]
MTSERPPTTSSPIANRKSQIANRVILALVLATGFLLHLIYLLWNCPLDLMGDEAQYWEWSRHLDLAYYSKGPLVAYVIRASCAIFGDVMWAVRLPALVLAVGTSICTYYVTAKLFRSERLALGVVLLTHTLPMFVVGSMLMTIDPPYYFCWALATALATKALVDESRLAWIGAGIAIGFGLLTKYAAPLWFVGLFAFLLTDRDARQRWLRTPWPWLALVIALSFFVVPLIWNIQHDWVTARHVGRQIGVTKQEGEWYLNPLLMLGTQFGVLTPIFAVFTILAVIDAVRGRTLAPSPGTPGGHVVSRARGEDLPSTDPALTLTLSRTTGRGNQTAIDPIRAARFLLAIGACFFLLNFVQSFFAETEANWPAPSYFTLVILVGCWLGERWNVPREWNRLRGFFWAHVVIGVVLGTLVHRTDWLYAPLSRFDVPPRKIDAQFVKMRGNAELGDAVSNELATLSPGAFVLTRTYQDAAILSFYVKGQPPAFHIGSYLHGLNKQGEPLQTRHSQWDLWPDRDLTPAKSPVIGRDAVFVGDLDEVGTIAGAFERIDPEPRVVKIIRHDVFVREMKVYRCYRFKGVERPKDASSF